MRHIGPDQPSPLQTQDDQPVEQFEPDRRNDEQIDAGDVGGVIAQESPASPESEGRDAVRCTWRPSTGRCRCQVSAARHCDIKAATLVVRYRPENTCVNRPALQCTAVDESPHRILRVIGVPGIEFLQEVRVISVDRFSIDKCYRGTVLEVHPPPVQVGAVAVNCALSVILMGIATAWRDSNNGMTAVKNTRRKHRRVQFFVTGSSPHVHGPCHRAPGQSVLLLG